MNTLKPLLIVAVLAGIGYGVYVRINGGNDAPPPGVAEGWNNSPQVQLGDGQPTGPAPWPGASPAAPGGAAPPFAPGGAQAPGGEAPPFSPDTAPPGGAPPFGDPTATAPPNTTQAQTPGPPGGSAPYAAPPTPAQPPVAGEAEAGIAPPDTNLPDRYQMPSADADRYQMPEPGAPDRYAAPNTDPGTPNAGDVPDAAGVTAPDGYAAPNTDPGAPNAGAAASAGTDRYGQPQGEPGVVYPQAEAAAAAPTPTADGSFADALADAQHELEAGQLATALEHLSQWYGDPRLTPAESQQLNQLLDQVAGTVVYSTQHLLEPPYEVQPGERLEDIGERYNVPWQLLAKINGIGDPNNLRPGERLKVIRGPFSALVSLDKRELTLLLANGAYAGRFPIGIGHDQPPREGTYSVSDKVDNPVYRGRDKTVGGGEQGNPLGDRWIGLGGELGIHGTDRPENIGRTDLPGSISMSPHDIQDVFDILATGSKVTIRR